MRRTEPPDPQTIGAVRAALATATSYSYTSGSTHHFYHYPARFAPPIAREVINGFSNKGDWVLDPFMGGGTTIIEGLALDRRLIGVDVNALAHFVTTVRTRPISVDDEAAIRRWAPGSRSRGRSGHRWIPRVSSQPAGSRRVVHVGSTGPDHGDATKAARLRAVRALAAGAMGARLPGF